MTDQAQVNVVEACAEAAHEVNRIYCVFTGDRSQMPWQEAPQWQKDSVRKGVRGALHGNTPEQSHESWLVEKRATGWVYGPIKDVEKKQHPCMVPYADLPDSQKMKDYLFVKTVRAMCVALGGKDVTEMMGPTSNDSIRFQRGRASRTYETNPYEQTAIERGLLGSLSVLQRNLALVRDKLYEARQEARNIPPEQAAVIDTFAALTSAVEYLALVRE